MKKTFQIAFIGTGLMGGHMAKNLCRAGHHVLAWNRTASKAESLRALGGKVAQTCCAAIRNSDIIISMLSDGPTVLRIIKDTKNMSSLKSGATWIDMSSTKPEEAREQSSALQTLDVSHLDAPVSGGTKGAKSATLAIMAAGEEHVFDRVRSVLEVMGRPVYVGSSGCGQLSKLANQGIVAVTIGAVAEAMLLLERGGADTAAVRSALRGGFADSTILQQHGIRMTTRNFIPGGPSKFQLKDLDNVMHEAKKLNLKLPVIQHIQDRFTHLVNTMEGGDKDHSALYLELLSHNH
ncbi:MAG: 2-hydroxy-3-oxopropionate reductase [Aestuariivita sp.]|nr:2-hydroxy-3-oxopropionate reductase [Aestuariivita sp.]